MFNIMKSVFYFFVTFVCVWFVWEFVMTNQDGSASGIRPSDIAWYFVSWIQAVFKFFGECFAYICSFLTYFDWTRMKFVISNNIEWITGTLISPTYFVKGFFEIYNMFEQKNLVLFGVFMSIISVFMSFVYYGFYKGHSNLPAEIETGDQSIVIEENEQNNSDIESDDDVVGSSNGNMTRRSRSGPNTRY